MVDVKIDIIKLGFYMEIDKDKQGHKSLSAWWNDGDSKLKKIFHILSSWWVDGSNKLIKSIYVSLFLHALFGIAWFFYYIFI